MIRISELKLPLTALPVETRRASDAPTETDEDRLPTPHPVAALRALADGEGRLAVRVTPGARSEGIEITDGRVLVKVRTKPEDGKASAAVLALLSAGLSLLWFQRVL